MRYLSVCSGIEAATEAWHPLGWEPVGFSEIEPFPSAVLKHRYPQVTNYGDMTKYEQWNIETIDLLVGGTPCQSFSVAGLRQGLHDSRGGLMLTFLEIAKLHKPRWIVWENVPGVLSSNGGRDFGSFLGALGELGYGWAYRVLDAQWFGVAQRRKRVFVVGCLGDGELAAKVLFEQESVCRNTPPSREAGEGIASNAKESTRETSDVSCIGGNTSPALTSKWQKGYGGPSGTNETGNMVYEWWDGGQIAATITKQNANGGQRMPDKDNFGAVIETVVIDRAAFNQGKNAQYKPHIETMDTMDTIVAKGPHAVGIPHISNKSAKMTIRRLTPRECERLQGFPDDHTLIPWRNKPADQCPDGPRYKALGNSMAVPCMAWIGKRINEMNNSKTPLACKSHPSKENN